jgi:hypothetical protein
MKSYQLFREELLEATKSTSGNQLPEIDNLYGGGVYVGDYKGYRIIAATAHRMEGQKLGVNWNEAKAFCKKLYVGKYSDWDLPSKPEMDLISRNMKSGGLMWVIGGLEYWTSTEIPGDPSQAYSRDFYNGSGSRGTLVKSDKNSTLGVIAVRREKI